MMKIDENTQAGVLAALHGCFLRIFKVGYEYPRTFTVDRFDPATKTFSGRRIDPFDRDARTSWSVTPGYYALVRFPGAARLAHEIGSLESQISQDTHKLTAIKRALAFAQK